MNAMQVALTDKFPVAVSLNSIKITKTNTAVGSKYGYLHKSLKYYLVVKENKLIEVQNLFANSEEILQLKKKDTSEQLSEVQNTAMNT